MARPGTQAEARTPVFTDKEIEALAAYVASLGPGPAIPSPNDYSTDGMTEEQIAQGGEFFRTNCTACHNFDGAGGALPNGRYAPSLLGVDREAYLRGDDHRPAEHADLLRRRAQARGEAADHRLPRDAQEGAGLRRFAARQPRARSPRDCGRGGSASPASSSPPCGSATMAHERRRRRADERTHSERRPAARGRRPRADRARRARRADPQPGLPRARASADRRRPRHGASGRASGGRHVHRRRDPHRGVLRLLLHHRPGGRSSSATAR